MTGARDPLEGLPDDLARVLRDPSVIVPQDGVLFERIAEWANAKSGTVSGAIEAADDTAFAEQCRARRTHPLLLDTNVRCTLDRDHDGPHDCMSEVQWGDEDSPDTKGDAP